VLVQNPAPVDQLKQLGTQQTILLLYILGVLTEAFDGFLQNISEKLNRKRNPFLYTSV